MKPGDFLSEYWFFSRKNAQYYTLMYLSQDLLTPEHILSSSGQKAITKLNKRRISIQEKIGKLNLLFSSVCKECKGKCCQGSIDYYFSAIDFWLRRSSSTTIEHYGIRATTIWHYILFRRLKLLKQYIQSEKVPEFGDGCVHLGENGCRLDVADRPILCMVSTCMKLRQTFDKQTKREYKQSIEGLFSISLITFDILKKEAGIPISHGRPSLFLTV